MNLISKLSQLPTPTPDYFGAEDQEGFRKTQRLAYQCAVDIGKEIKPGWTELQACELMDTYLRDSGVKSYFHQPFAWFGERTRFLNFDKYRHFMPTNRRLREPEAIILDVAPILDGYVADIGYTFSLVEHEGLKQAHEALRFFRKIIPTYFSGSMSCKEIWHQVDSDLRQRGYDNCHKQYPFSVLGHRVHRVPFGHAPSLVHPFGWHSFWSLLSRGLFPELLSPEHEGDKCGLWAIEPHLGGDGFGAKFEEILVVENKRAYWLDEKVPHMMGNLKEIS